MQTDIENSREALRVIYPTLYPELYRFIAYRIPHRQEAEDVISQIWLQAWEKLDRYDESRGTIQQWIVGIAKNQLKMYWRSHRLTIVLEEIADLLSDPRSGNPDPLIDDQQMLEKIFCNLSAEEKALLAMHYLDGMSYKEIAAITQSTAPALRQRLSRTIRGLRKTFSPML